MTTPSSPFSLTPLDTQADVALGQAFGEYRRFIHECRQCRDFSLDAEIEALEQALAEVEAEILQRGRLLLFLTGADDEMSALDHPLVADWTRRGWQVQTVRRFGSSHQPHFFVRLVAGGTHF